MSRGGIGDRSASLSFNVALELVLLRSEAPSWKDAAGMIPTCLRVVRRVQTSERKLRYTVDGGSLACCGYRARCVQPPARPKIRHRQ